MSNPAPLDPTISAHTALHQWHVAHGGRMVDFAGWSMPTHYTSIRQEHLATRSGIGLFDVSHMGRLHFFGPDAGTFLDSLLTRRVENMRPGQIRYGLLCNEEGGILDDILVYCLASDQANRQQQTTKTMSWRHGLTKAVAQAPSFQMVVNAANRPKIMKWLEQFQSGYSVYIEDITCQTAMIAVQGPGAISLVEPMVECDLQALRYYRGTESRICDIPCYISRTGYTGEDGCEVMVQNQDAAQLWTSLLEQGSKLGTTAVGLAARDTLRLEAAMPLYGHELTDQIDPVEAGLGFAMNLKNRTFVGCDAIRQKQTDDNRPVRIGLQLDGRRVPRTGQAIVQENRPVGAVTSGTFSPTFERPIAMGYVHSNASSVGQELTIDIRGTQHPAIVVPLPFYRRDEN